jgi:hypothetical protein
MVKLATRKQPRENRGAVFEFKEPENDLAAHHLKCLATDATRTDFHGWVNNPR